MSSRKSIDRCEVQYDRNLANDTPGIELDEDIDKREERIRRKERLARKEDRKRKREARALKHGASKRLRDNRLDELNTSDNEEPKPKSDVFVWKKKNEALKKQGIRLTEEDKRRRKTEIQDELERAKARRAQREQERAEWEAEQARLAREREQELNADWHRQEESFHGAQHFLRQAIRLGENRPTLLDSIAHTVRLDLIDVLAEPKSPLDVLDTELGELRVKDVDNLIEGVEKELDFVPDFPTDHDSNAFNRNVRHQYWSCVERYLKTIVEAMRDNFNESYPDGTAQESIQKEVDDLLEGKLLKELQEMEQEISSRVEKVDGAGRADGAGFGEVDFWSAALRKIRCNVSRLQLKELTATLRKERERLRSLRPKQEAVESKDGKCTSGEASQFRNDELLLRAEEVKGLAADEEKFSEEVEAPSTRKRPYVPGYLWNDKYRPRKPRYYNRVHTGYDWTKYNRTHYDHNNPPPKTVQGYKFNIFYPDLIDKSITPTFSISKTDNPEVCIITFKAGPPYEDIAFKIVNRPWEHSHRRGYRCSFDRGILYLWFNFQRYRYRR